MPKYILATTPTAAPAVNTTAAATTTAVAAMATVVIMFANEGQYRENERGTIQLLRY